MNMSSHDNVDENDDRPPTPAKDDCCGNSCNPCIFDVHRKLLEDWEKRKLNKLKIFADKNFLSLTRYNRFIVKDISIASIDCIFIQIDCGSDKKEDVLFLSPTQHVIIRLASTSRPYTPISWNPKSLKFLIKIYPNGLSSNSIKQLKVGDEIFVRGPYGEFKYQRNSYKDIIMLGIGTGIAAIYPLAVTIVKDELEDTKIKMILGFRSLSHVPLKKELRLLTDYWNFECTLCLSQKSNENITGINIVNGRMNEKFIDEVFDIYSSKSTLVLICGTPVFNELVESIVKRKQFFHYNVFR